MAQRNEGSPNPRRRVEGEEARYLRFLVHAGEILSESIDYHETLRNICNAAVETVADICLLGLLADQHIELVGFAHRNPKRTAALRRAGMFLRRHEGKPLHPAYEVIRTRKSIFVPDVDEAYIRSHSTSDEHARFMREMEYRSLIIVPVVSHVQGILGALTLVRTAASGQRYDGEAVFFAEDLGRRCGVAVSKAKLYSQAVDVSIRLQRAALPRVLPVRPGVSFDVYYEPAENQVLIGGDWYDAFNLPDGRIGVSIGDVTGHGIDAAVLMGSLRDAIRATLYGEPDLRRAVAIADYLIAEEFPGGTYATALLAIFDRTNFTLSAATAGHPGPLVWDPKTETVIDPFRERGLPLGLRELGESLLETRVLSLEKGSFAVFFTDGLAEWQRDYLEGERSLKAAISRSEIRNAPHPAKAIRDEVVRGTHLDDIAILTLRVDV